MDIYFIKSKFKSSGFTLVEVIITMGISSIVMLGALAIYVNTVRDNSAILDKVRLNYSLKSSINTMVSHIRRAGYWSNAQSMAFNPSIANPFMTASSTAASNTIVTIYNGASSSSSGDCILFSYNLSLSSTLPSLGASPDDRFGFRLNNGVIQYRVPSADFTCTGLSSSWENITDPNRITVTNLTFTEDDNVIDIGNGDTFTSKSIEIRVVANITNNPNIAADITQRANIKTGIFTD